MKSRIFFVPVGGNPVYSLEKARSVSTVCARGTILERYSMGKSLDGGWMMHFLIKSRDHSQNKKKSHPHGVFPDLI